MGGLNNPPIYSQLFDGTKWSNNITITTTKDHISLSKESQ